MGTPPRRGTEAQCIFRLLSGTSTNPKCRKMSLQSGVSSKELRIEISASVARVYMWRVICPGEVPWGVAGSSGTRVRGGVAHDPPVDVIRLGESARQYAVKQVCGDYGVDGAIELKPGCLARHF